MFVGKYSLPVKNNLNPTQLQRQSLLWSCRKVVQRYTKSFTHEDYANDTELSKEYREIKRSNFIPKATLTTVRECPPYNLSKTKCYLYLNEKLEINSYKGNNLLNKSLTDV